MSSINIKTAAGLVEVGGQVTQEKVLTALGYVPANEKIESTVEDHVSNTEIHIKQTERELWNSKSNFSGNYQDLRNAPDIVEDESGELNIADESGNVIVKVSGNGLETTEVQAQGIQLANTLINHISDNTEKLHVYSTEKEKWNGKSNFSCNYQDLKNAPGIVEDETGVLALADPNGNKIAQFDSDGFTTTKVIADNVIANGVDLGGKILVLDDDIDEVDTKLINHINNTDTTRLHVTDAEKTAWNAKATTSYVDAVDTKLNNHIANSDATKLHVTTEEKTIWNAKATTAYVDEKVAGIVDSAPENLNTLNELAAALNDNANFASTVLELIATKAPAADLASHINNEVVHITDEERTAWNGKSNFSGNYQDLKNAPNIVEDETGVLNFADESGNVIVKVSDNGIDTTQVSCNSFILKSTNVIPIILEIDYDTTLAFDTNEIITSVGTL